MKSRSKSFLCIGGPLDGKMASRGTITKDYFQFNAGERLAKREMVTETFMGVKNHLLCEREPLPTMVWIHIDYFLKLS